jgi:hypothetical protein
LLKLIELSDSLVKKRKQKIASKVLDYIHSLDSDDYKVKTELLMVSAKLFKSEDNYEQAILAFEECYYLASQEEDHKLKVKCIVSISSCYLELADLHKAIVYYHKLIDIESYLLSEMGTSETGEREVESAINLELRIAIRQNLYTAHLRLGKLRTCCYYLKEVIDITDRYFASNYGVDYFKLFTFIQIKMDSSLELLKLYSIFSEFVLMEQMLSRMLRFIETVIESNNDEFNEESQKLTEKQLNSLKYFKLKSFSYLGICMAGLREFRYSKLCTRKCLCLIDQELEKTTQLLDTSDKTEVLRKDFYALKTLKVEFLCDASLASAQYIKTFKDMYTNNIDLLINNDSSSHSKFDMYELNQLIEMYEESINYSKSAYLLSKTLIDPNIRAEATFSLAMSLYRNELYQSAAYYFNEVLSISSILLDTKYSSSNDLEKFYLDVAPDFHLEAGIYLAKCQLLADFFEIEQLYTAKSEYESVSDSIQKDSDETMNAQSSDNSESVSIQRIFRCKNLFNMFNFI